MYFQSHYTVVIANGFKEFYFWVVITDPIPNVILSALHFKHSLLNWRLKFMEMTIVGFTEKISQITRT